jgi:hypothetical protein
MNDIASSEDGSEDKSGIFTLKTIPESSNVNELARGGMARDEG